jgi:signal transduction histidine kinase
MIRTFFRSFTGQLLTIFSLLILALATFYVALTLLLTQRHLQAVDQSLNRELAAQIRDRYLDMAVLGSEQKLTRDAFIALMSLNPNAEAYLLDGDGRILAHAAPEGRVVATSVATAPIGIFLHGRQALPILGDDPRAPSDPKVFSAAPISHLGSTLGYVYVVLGGEAYSSASEMFRGSYTLRLSTGLLAGSVVIALALGSLSFYRMTRPLRQLTAMVARFDPDKPATAPLPLNTGDEIEQLARGFDQLRSRIAEQIEMLRQADAMRREFMIHISHDLKTPVATIQAHLETLLMKWDEMEAEQQKAYLASALKANHRIDQMIEAIFELARLNGSDAPLRFEAFSLTELVQDICQKLGLEAQTRGIGLVAELETPNVYMTGDIGLVERALVNIIQNAIKFSDNGGEIQVRTSEIDGHPRITVGNRGPVIPAEELEAIFIPFYRGRKTRQTKTGSGLGLAIAQRIAELHGGSIAVSSSEADGTTFTIGFRS